MSCLSKFKAWIRSKLPPRQNDDTRSEIMFPIMVVHIIGHSEFDGGGAYSDRLGSSEYNLYKEIFSDIYFHEEMVFVLDRNDGWSGVQRELFFLATEYPEHHFALIEWHFNAGGGHGYEVLTVNGRSNWLAELYLNTMGELFPMRKNRGIKFPKRGRYNLEITSQFGDAILVEPFFGDTSDAMTRDEVYLTIVEMSRRVLDLEAE